MNMASKKINANEVSNAATKFASSLYQELSKKPGNIFFSPISVHAVLSLAYQGAAETTAEALKNSLHLPNVKCTANGYRKIMTELNSVENVILHIANKVFLSDKHKLKDNFRNIATKNFLSEAQNLNFVNKEAAANEINKWIKKKTKDKIKDLISPSDLNSKTRLVLINAVYFIGNWLHEFSVEDTKKQKFYLNDKDTVYCDMMHITEDFDYGEDAELDAKILRLPYDNENVSMIIVLPNTKTGIFVLEQKLANKDLTTLTNQLCEVAVNVSLPKFKIETTLDLKEPLTELGLDVIFSDEAEFPNLIEEDEKLKVSKIIQKAFIEVDEKGCEAAATSSLGIAQCCSAYIGEPCDFTVNHPFLVMINFKKEEIHQVLFSGKIINPSELFRN